MEIEDLGRIRPLKIRVVGQFIVCFGGRYAVNKLVLARNTDNFHLTMGFYDKPEVIEIDIHKTLHDHEKRKSGKDHVPIAKIYIFKEKVRKIFEDYGTMITTEIEEGLKAAQKSISVEEIRQSGNMLMPLDNAMNLFSYNIKEIKLEGMEGMKRALGGPIISSELTGTEKVMMVLSGIRSMPQVIILKDGQYYTLNFFDLIPNSPMLIHMLDEICLMEVYVNGETQHIKFSEMFMAVTNNLSAL